jgi:hypothetical protein
MVYFILEAGSFVPRQDPVITCDDFSDINTYPIRTYVPKVLQFSEQVGQFSTNLID